VATTNSAGNATPVTANQGAGTPQCVRAPKPAGSLVAAALAAHADHQYKKAQALLQKHLSKFPTDGAAAALLRVTDFGLHQSKSEGGKALDTVTEIALEAPPMSATTIRPPEKIASGVAMVVGAKRAPLANASPFTSRMIRDPAEAGDGIPPEFKNMRYQFGVRSGTRELASYIQQGTAKISIVVAGDSNPLVFSYKLPSEQSSLEFADYAEGTLYLQAVTWNPAAGEQRSVATLTAFDTKTGKPRWQISERLDASPFLLAGTMILLPTQSGKVATKGRLEWIDAQTGSLVQSTPIPWPITAVEAEAGAYSMRSYDGVYDLKISGAPGASMQVSADRMAEQTDAEKKLELCLTEQALANIAKKDDAGLQATLDALSPHTREHALMDGLREERKHLAATWAKMTWDDVPFQTVPDATERPAAKQSLDKSIVIEPLTRLFDGNELGRFREGEPYYRASAFGEFDVPQDAPAHLGNDQLESIWPAEGHRFLIYGSRFLVIAKKTEAVAERIIDWGAEAEGGRFGSTGIVSAALSGDVIVACKQGGTLIAVHLPELSTLWQSPQGESCERELAVQNGFVYTSLNDRVLVRRIADGSIGAQKPFTDARIMGVRVRNKKVTILGFDTGMRGRHRGRF
jgi:hypothetical protein